MKPQKTPLDDAMDVIEELLEAEERAKEEKLTQEHIDNCSGCALCEE